MPEIIDHSITGFVTDADHALKAIKNIAKFDRRQVRARFEERFTSARMAQDYIRIYEEIRTTSRSHRTRAARIRSSILRPR